MSKLSTVLDVTDLFAGGGGSSTGAKAAGCDRGLVLRYALNHNATAIMVHNNNHPEADHYLGNVRQTNPRSHPRTRLLIGSPSCTDLSQAKTHKHHIDLRQYPMFSDDAKKYEAAIAERQSRTTMWDIVRFTAVHRYDAVVCENVWQVKNWEDYGAWWGEMEKLGYEGKTAYLNSMFFHSLNGVNRSRFAPQSRDRWYTIWRKRSMRPLDLDFRPLGPCSRCGEDVRTIQGWRNVRRQYGVWNRNYDYYCSVCTTKTTPYFYPAIHCIDFSIPIKRINDPTRKISSNTKRRIKAGLEKYGLHPVNLDKARGDTARSALLHPLFTQTGTATQTMSFPPQMIDLSRPYSNGNTRDATTEAAFTQTTAGFVISTKYSNVAQDCLPSVTTVDRHGLTEAELDSVVEDCYYRTLRPDPELIASMGMPADYDFTDIKKGKRLAGWRITRLLGQAVTPAVMEWLVSRVLDALDDKGASGNCLVKNYSGNKNAENI